MTEQEARDKVASLAEEWCRKGVWEWNANLDYLIKVYNDHKPITRNVPYSKNLKPNGWCALFVSVMFILANLANLIITEIGAYEFMANAKKLGRWKPRGTYIPKRGDIIVYAYPSTDESGKSFTQYHVGIVTSADANVVNTTEGNVQDRVLMLAHRPDDKTIAGYWAVDYASIAQSAKPIEVTLPDIPAKNGTYTLQAVVSNDKTTLKWV